MHSCEKGAVHNTVVRDNDDNVNDNDDDELAYAPPRQARMSLDSFVVIKTAKPKKTRR